MYSDSKLAQIGVIVISFLIYSILHSFFAAKGTKQWFLQHLPWFAPFYRITYTIAQSILLLLLFVYLPRPSGLVWKMQGTLYWVFRFMQALGALGFIWALSSFDLKAFLGLAQLKNQGASISALARIDSESFHTQGAFKFMRHPLYFFTIIIFLFEPHMTLFKFLLFTWLVLYFWLGSSLEERKMVETFGTHYKHYQKTVNRFLPTIFRS